MASIEKILKQMHRQDGSSHAIFKTLLAVLKSLGMQLSVEPENHLTRKSIWSGTALD